MFQVLCCFAETSDPLIWSSNILCSTRNDCSTKKRKERARRAVCYGETWKNQMTRGYQKSDISSFCSIFATMIFPFVGHTKCALAVHSWLFAFVDSSRLVSSVVALFFFHRISNVARISVRIDTKRTHEKFQTQHRIDKCILLLFHVWQTRFPFGRNTKRENQKCRRRNFDFQWSNVQRHFKYNMLIAYQKRLADTHRLNASDNFRSETILLNSIQEWSTLFRGQQNNFGGNRQKLLSSCLDVVEKLFILFDIEIHIWFLFEVQNKRDEKFQ